MDGAVLEGLLRLVDPAMLAWLVAGFTMGMVVGAIPGLNESTFLAIILPFTLYLDPTTAIVLMTSVYTGGEVGGEIPSILMRIPGTIGAVATTFEGFPLTMQGRGNEALGASLFASAFGTLAGAVSLLVIGPLLGAYALTFRSPEMFLIAVLGMTAIASVTGESVRKGLLSALLGLLIATTGADLITGIPRGTFELPYLYDGIPLLPALLGLFGFSELLTLTGRQYVAGQAVAKVSLSEALKGMRGAARFPVALIRSSIIGIAVGVIPGAGAATATAVAYGQARQWTRRPEMFGKGSIEGLASTDSSNNACVPATLIPTLTLGIPGSGTAAVLLAALLLHGVRPGPEYWSNYAVETYLIGWSVVLSAGLVLAMLPIVGLFARIARVPTALLVPLVALMSLVGAYLNRSLLFDVLLMVVFGVLGAILKRGGYSAAALVLALILGPLAEENLARSLQLGGVSVLFQSLVAIVLWLAIFASLCLPALARRFSAQKTRS